MDDDDVNIRIRIKEDNLSGGLQTKKHLDDLKQKAREFGRQSQKSGNDASGAFGSVGSAIGRLKAIMSGLGAVGLFVGLLTSIEKIKNSFKKAEDAAEDYAEQQKEAVRNKEVDDLAKSYRNLAQAIMAAAAANDHQNSMIAKAVEAERELEDAAVAASRQRELSALDPNDPAAAEKRAAIEAKYAGLSSVRSAERAKQNIVYRRQELNSQADQLDRSAAANRAAAGEDAAMMAKLRQQRSDALAASTAENEEDLQGFMSQWGHNINSLVTLDWGSFGDSRTARGDELRQREQQKAESIRQQIDKLEQARAEKLDKAREDELAARRKREEADIEASRLEAANINITTAESAQSTANQGAGAALERRQAQIAEDRNTIKAHGARKAEVQSRIDAANATLAAAAERANREDADVFAARQRLEQADAANQGKGWARYARGERQQLSATLDNEVEEANEAKVNLERAKNTIGEALQQFNAELRKLDGDLRASMGRMNVRGDGGCAE